MTTWCETGEACVYRLPCGMCELFKKECNLKEPKMKGSIVDQSIPVPLSCVPVKKGNINAGISAQPDDKKDKKDKIPSPGEVLFDNDDNFWIVLGVSDEGLDLFNPIHGADFGVKIDAYEATGWQFDEWRYIFDALLKKQINLDDD